MAGDDGLTTWTAAPFVPATTSLAELEHAARSCRGCPLYADTEQVVFGEGSRSAAIVLVGEQPGDQEDRQGRPFVGPAGRVLWACLDDAGIDRDSVYATNAVKHFKHELSSTSSRRPAAIRSAGPALPATRASGDSRATSTTTCAR